MLGVTVVSAVVQLALYVGGLVVAVLLRRRDGLGALLAALGFGCMLLCVLLSVGEGMAVSAVVGGASGGYGDRLARMQTTTMIFTVVIDLVRLAGFALVFAGLLHAIRRRPAPAPGMGAAR